MKIIISPGSGSVEGGTRKQAEENIKHYMLDCNLTRVKYVYLQKDLDGRFEFLLYTDQFGGRNRCHSVEMPGLPLSQVRFMKEEDQNPWHFPRLYIDGSSWLWCFAMLEQKDFEPEDWQDE